MSSQFEALDGESSERASALSDIVPDTPNIPLYHYTTQAGILGIVTSEEIWATHHQCLNDSREFMHAKRLLKEVIEQKARARSSIVYDGLVTALEGKGFEETGLFVASFSEDRDSLSQWRAYGGPTSGYVLGFDLSAIKLPDRFRIVRCIYDTDQQRELLRDLVDKLAAKLSDLSNKIGASPSQLQIYCDNLARTTLHKHALRLKNHKFKEELEWRIISVDAMNDAWHQDTAPLGIREGKSTLIPYRRISLRNQHGRLPLTEIVVGPNPNTDQSVRSVKSLLASQGYADVKVRPSEVPYRNW